MAQEKKILLEIVTPQKVVLSKQVDEVRMPGMKVPHKESQLGVWLRHTPLITSLHAGELIYRIGKREKHFCVGWGFAEILNDKVTVLVETAESAREIDLARAKKAKELAEEKLREKIADKKEHLEVNSSLKKAIARINVAGKSKGSK